MPGMIALADNLDGILDMTFGGILVVDMTMHYAVSTVIGDVLDTWPTEDMARLSAEQHNRDGFDLVYVRCYNEDSGECTYILGAYYAEPDGHVPSLCDACEHGFSHDSQEDDDNG